MNPEWFWEAQGELYGPLTTDELENLVKRGRIADGDRIRLDGGDWMEAAAVQAMFAGQAGEAGTRISGESGGSGQKSAAESASNILSHVQWMQLGRQGERTTWLGRVTHALGRTGGGVFGILALGRDLAIGGLQRLWPLLSRKTTLAVIAALFLAVLLRNVEFGDTRTEEAHAQLAATWDEIQGMKKRGAPRAQWQEYERETLEWLEPTLEELGESAVRNQSGFQFWSSARSDAASAQRNLVGAGWALAEVLSDAANPSRDAEPPAKPPKDKNGSRIPPLPAAQTGEPPDVVFSKRMNMAQAFLKGEVAGPKLAEGVKIKAASVDPLIVGMIVLDAGVVVGAGVFWWRRRRR